MTATTAEVTRPRSLLYGGVVPLLGMAVFINYVDRGILPSAAPLMKDELHLNAGQIGVLLSAFFWTYTPCQLLSGWLAERIGPFRTLGIGVAIWSLATAAFGVASGFSMLIALRLVLGVGESAAFACASKLFAARLPADRLGMANGVITLGLALGPAFGAFAGGMLMAGIGWRPVFLVFGLASLLWLWPWIAASRFAASSPERLILPPTPPLRAVLRQRSLWGAGLGHFAGNYTLYFVVSWLPLFLVKARGFSMAEMATLSGAIYLAYAASGWITGWATDRWIASGVSQTLARKTFLIGGNVVTAVGMAVCAVGHGPVVIVTLFVIAVSFGFVSPNLFAVGQTLAGPRASGIWIGAQNCIGNTAGIVGPLLTGVLIDRTHAWGWAFAATGVSALLGVIGWAWIVQRVEPVDWD
jgi:MFS family permease